MNNTLKKYWRLAATMLAIVAVVWVLFLIRGLILPFVIGLVLAYLLMPLVNWLERNLPPRQKWPDFKRVFSVIIAFLVLIAVIGGFGYILVTTIIDASVSLIQGAPFFLGQSLNRVQQWLTNVIATLPPEMQQEVSRNLVEAGISLGQNIRDAFFSWIATLQGTIRMFLGFAVLPFFLFYLLKDSEGLKKSLSRSLPQNVAFHGRNMVTIVEMVLGRYIRAQGMLGLIVAYFTFIGLLLLQVPYPLALALIAGVSELVPTIGPWIGGAVSVFVALAMAPEKAIWVAVLFLGVQLVENSLLVPRIQSAYLHIHPAIMIFLLVAGSYVAGIWGLLLVGPLTATFVEVFKYVRDYCEGKPCQLPDFSRRGN
ncbi:MAG: hypothetical protein A2137_03620 [Chloroflexi bacterium RBG_16_58_8]|nr:MAG: hypothetical protein A2137_03620 [Chloroflexi bacterium RBG_16_58_8]